MRNNVYIYIWQSLRPQQWTKNLFIFAGILFSQNIFNPYLFLKVLIAFVIFCFLSGSLYIFNDLIDLEQDKHHPVKSRRPLASGKLKVSYALLVLIIFIIASLFGSFYLDITFFAILLGYIFLQVIYSFFLKRIVILDIFAIAIGFVLRVVGGAVVINVEISSWLIICTFLLALFLGLGKRRNELLLFDDKDKGTRKVLKEYTPYLVDQMISVVTAATIISYSLYTISEDTILKFGTKNLIFSIPFVLYGIFRYLYLIQRKEIGGNPEMVLIKDKPLMIDILIWIAIIGIILYL